MLLLDENQEVLTLVTNSLKKCVQAAPMELRLTESHVQRPEPFQSVCCRTRPLHPRQHCLDRDVERPLF